MLWMPSSVALLADMAWLCLWFMSHHVQTFFSNLTSYLPPSPSRAIPSCKWGDTLALAGNGQDHWLCHLHVKPSKTSARVHQEIVVAQAVLPVLWVLYPGSMRLLSTGTEFPPVVLMVPGWTTCWAFFFPQLHGCLARSNEWYCNSEIFSHYLFSYV